MSWVSYSKLQALCQALRNKFTTGEMVIANDDKSIGAHLNHTAQDGLVTISPITEDGVTPAALWVTDSAANNATELTGGTLTYVTDNGKETEDYTSLSLVGGVVNVSGKSGEQRRITNVADPVDDNDAVNKKAIADLAKYELDYPAITHAWKQNISESINYAYSNFGDVIKYEHTLKKGHHIITLMEENVSSSPATPIHCFHHLIVNAYDAEGKFYSLSYSSSNPQHAESSTDTPYFSVNVYCPVDMVSLEVKHQLWTVEKVTSMTINITLVADLYLGV